MPSKMKTGQVKLLPGEVETDHAAVAEGDMVRRRIAQLELINEVGRRVGGYLKMESLLQEVAAAVHESFGYYRVMLLVDEDSQRMKMQSVAGGYAHIFTEKFSMNIGEGMIGHVAKTGQTQLSRDVTKNPYYVSKMGEKARSELTVPIKKGSDVIAVLDLQSNEWDAFDQTDVMVMETLADQIGTAIENARLYETVKMELTEHRATEEALIREKEKFRVLVEESPLGTAIIDKDNRLKYVNTKFVEIFGYTIEDIPTGMDWFQKAYPDPTYRKKAVKNWLKDKAASKIGESRPRTYWVTCKDDVKKRIHFRSVTMETMDQFVIYEDITERKRLEAKLLQAQKMESIGTLAGGIAHDFNNLLMGIQGRTSLMLLKIDRNDPYYVYLKEIEEYIESASALTRQLLGFARGGKYEVRLSDLNEIVEKSATLFGRTKKEITIHRNYQEAIWPVEVDQAQFEQVLLNLFVNAWQAMTGAGNLYIQTENTVLPKSYTQSYRVDAGKYVKVSITDTGVGIDEENQEKIFDPFFTTKELERGTGMGLASAYGIIRNHGGIITVYSSVGKGATFNIFLPVSGKHIAAQKEVVPDMVMGKETILLVDDEDMILNVDRDILRILGYTVMVARNGKEAVKVYQEHMDTIDLVILDMIMPDMSGSETYDLLKKLKQDIRVLLSSGYSINGWASEILGKGCNGFIQKPFNLHQLSLKIRDVLDGR